MAVANLSEGTTIFVGTRSKKYIQPGFSRFCRCKSLADTAVFRKVKVITIDIAMDLARLSCYMLSGQSDAASVSSKRPVFA